MKIPGFPKVEAFGRQGDRETGRQGDGETEGGREGKGKKRKRRGKITC
jgi:hypothetical protein